MELAWQRERIPPVPNVNAVGNVNNANNDAIVANAAENRPAVKIPWFKFFLVIVLLFLVLVLQITIVTLDFIHDVAVAETSKNTKSPKSHESDVTIPPLFVEDEGDSDNLENNPTIDERQSSVVANQISSSSSNIISSSSTTSTTTSSSTTSGSTTGSSILRTDGSRRTVKYFKPADPNDIYLRNGDNTPFSGADTGQSILTARNAYWNQFLQSGILDWESKDSFPSIGASTYLLTKQRQRFPLSNPPTTDTSAPGSSTSDQSADTSPPTFSMPSLSKFLASFFSSGDSSKLKVLHNSHVESELNNDNNNPTQNNLSKHDLLSQKMNPIISHHNRTTNALHALQKAAELGHPRAQLLLANAYSAGFYPFIIGDDVEDSVRDTATAHTIATKTTSTKTPIQYPIVFHQNNSRKGQNTTTILKVSDEWLLDGKNPMHAQAMLLWHMAAQHGSIEASITLANRLWAEHVTRPANSNSLVKKKQLLEKQKKHKSGLTTTSSAITQELCRYRLPYFAAAAHGIMDQLQTDPQSRGHVLPAKDKHLLYQIHLHGSKAAKLDKDNQPDERLDALEFYQVKASDLLARHTKGVVSTPPTDPAQEAATLSDGTKAAYTLARYYHQGVRGAAQNLTLALKYYEAAGYNGHWEAAGQAGLLYLWGIGTEQDIYKAHHLFILGMPWGYEGCLEKYQMKIQQKKLEQQVKRNVNKANIDTSLLEKTIHMCDDASLNGMGLLRLVGVPMIVSVDVEKAIDLFELARDQGNSDAAYNLAMTRLGWKTHFRSIKDINNIKPKVKNDISTTSINGVNGVNDHKELDTEGFSEDDSKDDSEGDNESDKEGDSEDNAQTLVGDDGLFDFLFAGLKTKNSGSSKLVSTNKKGDTIRFDKSSRHFPTSQEYQQSLTDLTTAAKANIHANHRLAMMYEHGVQIPAVSAPATSRNLKANGKKANTLPNQVVVHQDCVKAAKHYQWVIDYGSPDLNARLRLAYKLYTSGNTADSLRHYLVAAEMGHGLAQLNAAFLLDQGECLNGLLSPAQCASAAVRLWKASSAKENSEASMRVGDYYYYGKFRHEESSIKKDLAGTVAGFDWGTTNRPFGWIQHIIFPEDYLLPYAFYKVKETFRSFDSMLRNYFTPKSIEVKNDKDESYRARLLGSQVCNSESTDRSETCLASSKTYEVLENDTTNDMTDTIQSDLEIAAQYYRLAAERDKNQRAHYNLGFMYQWGLGLKQDFPLAKRHYDLARDNTGQAEAEVPVLLALIALNAHEFCVKLYLRWQSWNSNRRLSFLGHSKIEKPTTSSLSEIKASELMSDEGKRTDEIRVPSELSSVEHQVSGNQNLDNKSDTISSNNGIFANLLTWQSLLLFVITVVASIVLQRHLALTTEQ